MLTPEQLALHSHEDGDCIVWTGGCCNGHPAIRIDGKTTLVRRALWVQANGFIPPGRVLRCTCGTSKCINLDHCEAMTYKAIAKIEGAAGKMSDPVRSAKIAAAKRAGSQAKITQEQAREIRTSDEPLAALGARYGISESTASRIKRNTVRREFGGNPWQGLGA